MLEVVVRVDEHANDNRRVLSVPDLIVYALCMPDESRHSS